MPVAFHIPILYKPIVRILFRLPPISRFIRANQSAITILTLQPDLTILLTLIVFMIP
uniref:TIDP3108 n=1 Tax=Arundo donax TaxID=35708 RepID=A0A0A9CLT9_ARUDO